LDGIPGAERYLQAIDGGKDEKNVVIGLSRITSISISLQYFLSIIGALGNQALRRNVAKIPLITCVNTVNQL
jgi:hypothetical protein